MARDIDRVMRLIVDAEQLDASLMRDADMLLQGLTAFEKLNIIQVAIREWQGRQDSGQADTKPINSAE
ncbi:MAG: hypothetical protein ACTSX7_11605 [Alphaproteobacteria bacterium]